MAHNGELSRLVARAVEEAARFSRRGGLVLMPWVRGWKMTERAAMDALDQDAVGEMSLLLWHNVPGPLEGEQAAEDEAAHAFCSNRASAAALRSCPAGTLGKLWNGGLKVAEMLNHTDVLVCNNDIRIHPLTYLYLRTVAHATGALFVGASNCAAEGTTWVELRARSGWWPALGDVVEGALTGNGRGGPDFSCFLVTKECWEKYQFDEELTYFGDNDYHRQLVLGGDEDRIFGACVPYWHIGSQTIALAGEEERARLRAEFERHRAIYQQKWGGGVGEERWSRPYGGLGEEAEGA